jgi:hypothetical protein
MSLACIAGVAMLSAGCGQVARTGRAPVQIVINSLEGASGADKKFGGMLFSDVVTMVKVEDTRVPTIFGDSGQVTMSLILKDPGIPGATASPSELNQVTINRYHVTYRRADGRNTPGVDVPYGFDGAVTFTIPPGGTATASFELVRHVAKEEAPLVALKSSSVIISTLAEITFYGRDQVGNDISAVGTIGVEFGNFGDPQ